MEFNSKGLITADEIQRCIQEIRGRKVILDVDLAKFYGIAPKVLNQAVKRNAQKFPPDFVFQLKNQEVILLRSQSVTANVSPKSRSLPYAMQKAERKFLN